MAMKVYSIFSISLELEPHYQMQFNVITRTHLERERGDLPLCRVSSNIILTLILAFQTSQVNLIKLIFHNKKSLEIIIRHLYDLWDTIQNNFLSFQSNIKNDKNVWVFFFFCIYMPVTQQSKFFFFHNRILNSFKRWYHFDPSKNIWKLYKWIVFSYFNNQIFFMPFPVKKWQNNYSIHSCVVLVKFWIPNFLT